MFPVVTSIAIPSVDFKPPWICKDTNAFAGQFSVGENVSVFGVVKLQVPTTSVLLLLINTFGYSEVLSTFSEKAILISAVLEILVLFAGKTFVTVNSPLTRSAYSAANLEYSSWKLVALNQIEFVNL